MKISGCGLYEIWIGENNDPSVGHPVAFCPYRVHALSRRCFCRGCSPASSTNELHQLDCGTSGIPGAPVLGGSGPGPRSSARPGTSGGLGPYLRVRRLWMGCGTPITPLPMLLTRIWTRSFGRQRGRPNVCRHTKNGKVSI